MPAAGVRVELWRGDELVGSGETDVDGRIRRARRHRARHLPDRLLSRPRRSSGGSSWRSTSGLATTTSRCSSPRTRARATAAAERRGAPDAVRGAHRASSSGSPRWRIRSATPARSPRRSPTPRRRRCSTRTPRSAAATLSARSAAEQGTDDGAAELTELNRAYEERFGFRFVVFVNRRPKSEIVPILRARLERTREEELDTALDELIAIAEDDGSGCLIAISDYWWGWGNLLFRWLHVIAAIAWIGSSFYFIALDNHLLPPAEERDAERGVGGEVWEIHGGGFYRVEKFRSRRTSCPSPLLVQVGGVHDVALGLRAARRRLLRPPEGVPRRPERDGPDELGGDRDRRRRARRRLGRLRRALPPARRARVGARGRGLRVRLPQRLGGRRAARAAGRVHRGRRDARHDHGRRTSSS